MPPNSDMIRGRDGATKHFADIMKMGVKDAVFSTVELHHKGDAVVEIGNYTVKIHSQGQAPFEDKGSTLFCGSSMLMAHGVCTGNSLTATCPRRGG